MLILTMRRNTEATVYFNGEPVARFKVVKTGENLAKIAIEAPEPARVRYEGWTDAKGRKPGQRRV